MIYIISKDGQPLMPTERRGKIRRMLKSGQAKVVSRCPFTVQLQCETEKFVQPISLGVDAGSKNIGLSATTKDKVLYEGVVELRNDIVDLLSNRREKRRARRNRKTRYRAARFNNRTKPEGWIAPSVRQKVECHLNVVDRIARLLPVSSITAEVASFDVQKVKNPDIEGECYQQGDQLGFWNVREYVLCRDNHTCQCCKGKSKDKILNVHHIESRKTGGDAPNNLITLCETCHKAYHRGEIKLPEKVRRGVSYRDAAFMGIMRWAFYNELKERFQNVGLTYGYITKNTRIRNGLPKSHNVDARCISGNPMAESDGTVYSQKKIRCHNRRLHRDTILKGGYRKRNQAEYKVKGFRLFDKVQFKGQECFVAARRATGSFQVRKLDGTVLSSGVTYKKLKFLETRKPYLIERRCGDPSLV